MTSGLALRQAPVPHRRRVLHDAALRRGRRPAPDPLAERCPQRRADDPPGRVHPALDRGPVRRHPGHRRRSDPHAVLREGDLGRGVARDLADALRVLRQARHDADAAAARRGGEPARRARGDDPPLLPSPVDRSHAPADGGRERHDPGRGRRAAGTDRAAVVAPRGRDVRPQGRGVRPRDRTRHPSPDRRAQVEGRASQARMSLSRTGWEVVVLPPSRRLRDAWHVERTQPLVTSGS